MSTSNTCWHGIHLTCNGVYDTYSNVRCTCICHTTAMYRPTSEDTMTDFTPTHRITNNDGTHSFPTGTLVVATGDTGQYSGNPGYRDGTGHKQYVDDDAVELIAPEYEEGKLYTVARTMIYDAGDGVFRPYRGSGYSVGQTSLRDDPSATVERVPNPLPTAFGAIVSKDGTLYCRVDDDETPWRAQSIGDSYGGWASDDDVKGADVLYEGLTS